MPLDASRLGFALASLTLAACLNEPFRPRPASATVGRVPEMAPAPVEAPKQTAAAAGSTGPDERPAGQPLPRETESKPIPPGMLLVPGGVFQMGADDEGEQDERPAHSVTIASFLLDQTEVTNAAYAECVSAGECRASDPLTSSPLTYGHPEAFRKPDKPAVGVSWFDASAYCAFRGKRLPREAEWERAARGSDARRYVWGNEAPDPRRQGVFGGRSCTEPVGSYPDGRGPYGHFDLAGNVWEWVADEYDPYAYRRSGAARGEPGGCVEILEALAELRRRHLQGFTGKNPIPVECERVLRGGAYNYGVSGLRASNRVHHPASFRIAVAGFRCAADVAAPSAEATVPAGLTPQFDPGG